MAAAAGNADERACHAGLITVPANNVTAASSLISCNTLLSVLLISALINEIAAHTPSF